MNQQLADIDVDYQIMSFLTLMLNFWMCFTVLYILGLMNFLFNLGDLWRIGLAFAVLIGIFQSSLLGERKVMAGLQFLLQGWRITNMIYDWQILVFTKKRF